MRVLSVELTTIAFVMPQYRGPNKTILAENRRASVSDSVKWTIFHVTITHSVTMILIAFRPWPELFAHVT